MGEDSEVLARRLVRLEQRSEKMRKTLATYDKRIARTKHEIKHGPGALFGCDYRCGVGNCGGGACVHEVTKEPCPNCGWAIVHVTCNGHRFCSNSDHVCDWEQPTK